MLSNPHIDPAALAVVSEFVSRVHDRVIRQRLSAIYALHPKRWGGLKPDIFWTLGWVQDWSMWPVGVDVSLKALGNPLAWVFPAFIADFPSHRPLDDILAEESGCLVLVPGMVDLALNCDGGMAINWIKSKSGQALHRSR